MTRFFSKTLVKWLLKTGAISQQDADVYEYGIYSFLFSLIPFALVLVLSIPLGMVTEGFLLIVPFFFLRKFTRWISFSICTPMFSNIDTPFACESSRNKSPAAKAAPTGCLFGGIPLSDPNFSPKPYRLHQPQTHFKGAKGFPQNCHRVGLFFRNPLHTADGIRIVSNRRPYRWWGRSYSVTTAALFTRRNTKNSKKTVIFPFETSSAH